MAAVNLQVMSNLPLDFLPHHSDVHSRSNSVSSSSTHSSMSRPQSSHGLPGHYDPMGPTQDDLYRASYHLGHYEGDHVRISSCSNPSSPHLGTHIYPCSFFQSQAVTPSPLQSPKQTEPQSRQSSRLALRTGYRQRPFVVQRNGGDGDVPQPSYP